MPHAQVRAASDGGFDVETLKKKYTEVGLGQPPLELASLAASMLQVTRDGVLTHVTTPRPVALPSPDHLPDSADRDGCGPSGGRCATANQAPVMRRYLLQRLDPELSTPPAAGLSLLSKAIFGSGLPGPILGGALVL